MKVARPALLAATAAAGMLTVIAYFCAEDEPDMAAVFPADGRQLSESGTLNSTSKFGFLTGVEKLYGQASSGCMACCDGGSCNAAFQSSQAGVCCSKTPAFCCPSGTTCVTNPQLGCQRPSFGNAGQGQMGSGYGGAGYGGGTGMTGQPMYGQPQPNPMQKVMRFIRDHMMMIWLILLVLGCLGVGGGCTHHLSQLLCGLSLFNMFASQSMQNEMYGPPGGGGAYAY